MIVSGPANGVRLLSSDQCREQAVQYFRLACLSHEQAEVDRLSILACHWTEQAVIADADARAVINQKTGA
jgi:hypothetical protein